MFKKSILLEVIGICLLLVVSSLYSAEELSKTNIGSFTASNTPLYIQVCKDGTHKGEFSIIKGSKTLYYGKASGKTKDNLYFYVPIELKVTYQEKTLYMVCFQDRYIESSPYEFASIFQLKNGGDIKFKDKLYFETRLLHRTISKRFLKIIKPDEKEGIGNERSCYIAIAPREDFNLDKVKREQIKTTINLVLFQTFPSRLLKADVKPANKKGELLITIITRFVDEKTFLRNLSEPRYVDTAYWRPDAEIAQKGWIKEKGIEGAPAYVTGSIHIYLKNLHKRDLSIKRIALNGSDIGKIYLDVDEMPPFPYSPTAFLKRNLKPKDILWYRVFPNPIKPGGISEIIIRPREKPKTSSARIEIFTDIGEKIITNIPISKPKISLSYVAFPQDLKTIYVYVRKFSPDKISLSRIYLDGKDVTANSYIPAPNFIRAEKVLYPVYTPEPSLYKDLSLIKINLDKALKKGSSHTIKVVDRTGKISTAYAVRAFPSDFLIGASGGSNENLAKNYSDHLMDVYWAFGGATNIKTYDLVHKYGMKAILIYSCSEEKEGKSLEYYCTHPERLKPVIEHPGLYGFFLMDEPDGAADAYSDGTPGDNLGNFAPEAERCRRFLQKYMPSHPTVFTLDNTYRPMNYFTYGEIPDLINCHSGWSPPFIRNAVVLAMQRDASAPRPVSTIPNLGRWSRKPKYLLPEYEKIIVYDTIALGGKGVIYYPVHGGILDLREMGTQKAKLWAEVGRLNAEIKMLKPLLSIGDTLPLAKTNIDTIEASTILCGDRGIVLVLLNRNYLGKSTGITVFPAKDVEIKVRIPEFIKVKDVFGVSYEGVKRVGYQLRKNVLSLKLKEVKVGSLFVLATQKDMFDEMKQFYTKELKVKLEKIRMDIEKVEKKK